jgi:biopolymer transport protein ExbB/biopolymer transport protein TolQ
MLVQKLLGVASITGSAVLYILLSLSVLSIGIVFERLWYFARRRIDTPAVGKELLAKLRANDLDGARAMLKAHRSVEAAVVAEALDWHADGSDSIAEILAGALRERRPEFESGLLFLGTLGNNAPFVGLFGTVLGIVTAFKELGNAAAGGMNGVMGGIAEALVATAVGILVALPAVVSYNYLQKKTLEIEDNVMTLGNIIAAHMKSIRAPLKIVSAIDSEPPRIHAVAAGEKA